MKLAEMTWPQVQGLPRQDVLVVFPIGSCEQHSHHLPFLTDTLLVTAVAEELERRHPQEVLLLPTQWLGASQHHMPFPGTLTASTETHLRLLTETIESLVAAGFRRFLVLNGHGGNEDTMRLALREMKARRPQLLLAAASYWEPALPLFQTLLEGPLKREGHACELETSLMLALYPHLVRSEAIANDGRFLPGDLRGVYVALTFAERTFHGGLGYAEQASAEKGGRLLEAILSRLEEVVRALREWPLEG